MLSQVRKTLLNELSIELNGVSLPASVETL